MTIATQSTVTGTTRTSAPQYQPDHRPAADAAALREDQRAAAAAQSQLPVSLPGPVSQIASVSKAMVGTSPPVDRTRGVAPSAFGQGAAQAERVLKPWGVTMLPADPAPRKDAGGREGRPDDTADATMGHGARGHGARDAGAPDSAATPPHPAGPPDIGGGTFDGGTFGGGMAGNDGGHSAIRPGDAADRTRQG